MVTQRRRRPLAWLDPEAARTGSALQRRTRLLLTLAVVLSNMVGATIVFVLANFVVPTPTLSNADDVRLTNLIAFGVYLATATVVGTLWGQRRMKVLRGFLEEERDPDRAERREVLLGPLRLTVVNAVLWLVATVVFGILNASFSGQLGVAVAFTVALGGITTTGIAYLLSERVLRAATGRAMAARPPRRPVVPGVAARSVIAWALGTGVPLLALVVVAVYTLSGEDIDRDQLALTVVGLGGVALVIGLLAVILAARASADPITSVRKALAEVERGDLEVEVPVYDASELGLLQAGFNQMVEGLRERERIREAFGTYVDSDVAEHILREGTSLEGEVVEVTVMFLDVRDFTGFAEQAPAPEVVSTLNRLFETVVPIIREHGGHVDKFVGDGLLAVFGAPRRDPDHAERALAAAKQIAEAVSKELGDTLSIGIGLNSGTVVAGNIGGAGRLDFSVIGDAVNVAARVEAATRETGDTILISEQTKDKLGEGHRFQERLGVELKGKREPVTLYAVSD
ncbi:MAG: adenylate/guanylate cyclase domain-containing protein [Actinomycetota bacterium]|nr:adenylate/guanylate cyclase domain-containing protein [Actinomycetota bacterium]